MKSNILFIAALILFDGVAVAWAAWEFWSMRKSRTERSAETGASEEPPGHPEGQHGPDNG